MQAMLLERIKSFAQKMLHPWDRKRFVEGVFTRIYRNREWGKSGAFYSGLGSTPEYSSGYEKFIEDFIRHHGISSVLDLGCGDFQVASRIHWGNASYVGMDIVQPLIERNTRQFANERVSFVYGDMFTDELPQADLCLIRQALQHHSNASITAFLPKLAKFPYVLITDEWHPTAQKTNADLPTGSRVRRGGLHLEYPPFNLHITVVFGGNSLLRTVLYQPGR